jgi:hypothetical protein
MTPRLLLATLLVATVPGGGAAPIPECDAKADAAVASGWTHYRSGRLERARRDFDRARTLCPEHAGARVGLGYVALRADERDAARGWFTGVLDRRPDDGDALVGLGIVAWRDGEIELARDAFSRAAARDPGSAEARRFLADLPAGPAPPASRRRPDTLEIAARAAGDRLEVWQDGRWRPFYVKGVNLGAALPGRYPSEFPGREVYASWIADLAALGANTIRVYTIHPPDFYSALAAHNAGHPDRPLRLLHGVWAELPPRHDFDDAAWRSEFEAEMRRVVDVIHGAADVAPRPGHAAGAYRADVSRWTLGVIVGREMEPFAVEAYNRAAPSATTWKGRYVETARGTPMERWLARALDRLVAYETEAWHAQRPVAYTTWPTLDPLHHPTETTLAEERALLRSLGEQVDDPPFDHDEDAVELDPSRLRPTAAFPAGVFAAYHAYPYYPDFLVLDPGYDTARSRWGRSNYFGYLTALKARHPGMPVIIAEYGVPAGLGVAHVQPQGWHHGGHTEAAMAAVDARLTREIAAAGMAGGVVFAWIDEWFKRNWLVSAFELPAERNRLWLNRLDPEQMYGLIAMEPAPILPGATLADRLAAWRRVPVVAEARGAVRVRAAADAAQLWLLVEPAQGGGELYLGFDVVRPGHGSFRWPERRGPELPLGLELVAHLSPAGVRLVADPAVNPYRLVPAPGRPADGARATPVADPPPGFFTGWLAQVPNSPFVPVRRDDGVFDSLRVLTNRTRFGRDGARYAALGYDRGVLPAGEPPDGAWARDAASGAVELRLPWMLLNVTDPSSRSVLFGADAGGPGTVRVDDIGIVVAAPRPDGAWPTAHGRFTWRGWEEPAWRARRRPAFDALRAAFAELEPMHEASR